jgi:hypothetical protein
MFDLLSELFPDLSWKLILCLIAGTFGGLALFEYSNGNLFPALPESQADLYAYAAMGVGFILGGIGYLVLANLFEWLFAREQ